MSKVFPDAATAIRDLPDHATVLVGGFGLCGIPEELILALRDLGRRDLTIVSNNAGTTHHGLVHLLRNKQVKKVLASYVGENDVFEQLMLSGELDVELVPQGTLAERMRAGGAGIPGFYTATGVGTKVAEGKETRAFDGREYVLERGIVGDFALVHAWKADGWGNLLFREAARNFNPVMATAAKVTIAEAEQVVPVGTFDPDQVHVPGIYVKRLVKGERYQKWIERRTVRPRKGGA